MKLINTNRFYLTGTNNRFLHVASVSDGLREYMCFHDRILKKTYIEEITGGHLEFISDDKLAQEIFDFLVDVKILDMSKPMLADNEWLKLKPKHDL